MFRRPAWLCSRFASCVATQQNATFLGVAHPGGGLWPTDSNLAEIFVRCIYRQVSSSYVYSFGSYRVDKHTHRPTDHTQKKRFRRQHPTFFATLWRWVKITSDTCYWHCYWQLHIITAKTRTDLQVHKAVVKQQKCVSWRESPGTRQRQRVFKTVTHQTSVGSLQRFLTNPYTTSVADKLCTKYSIIILFIGINNVKDFLHILSKLSDKHICRLQLMLWLHLK